MRYVDLRLLKSDNSDTVILQRKARLKILIVIAEMEDGILSKQPFLQNKDSWKKTKNCKYTVTVKMYTLHDEEVCL